MSSGPRCFSIALLPVIVALATTVTYAQAPPADGSELASRVLPSVVTLKTYDEGGTELGLGSGYIVERNRVVTNAHVVSGCAYVEILSAKGGEYLGTATFLSALSTSNDLAVLPLWSSTYSLASLPLSVKDAEPGAAIWVFSSPLGLEGTVSAGIVSAYREYESRRYLQITAPISQGSSGGPVVDATGQVLGTIISLLPLGQNLNFAVPSSVLRPLLASPEGRFAFPVGTGGVVRNGSDIRESESSSRNANADYERAITPITLGTNKMGILDSEDMFDGDISDVYRFSGIGGQRVCVGLIGIGFDPVCCVLEEAGLASGNSWRSCDDDGGGGTSSYLIATLPRTGSYILSVGSYDRTSTGSYLLTLECEQATARGGAQDRWVVIADNSERTMSIDTRTVDTAGTEVTCWVRTHWKKSRTSESGKLYDTDQGRYRLDCSGRRMTLVRFEYRSGDELVESRDFDTWEQKWYQIAPETYGEGMLDWACRSR